MVCVYCAHDTRVTNSRLQKRTNTVWRRRRCTNCGSTITTEETPRYETTLMVRHANGSLAPLSRDRLLISLYKSLAHRITAAEDASALTGTILGLISEQSGQGAVIEANSLHQQAAECLERFDTAAGSHYRAYHPQMK